MYMVLIILSAANMLLFVDLYIKQNKTSHALYIGLLKYSACSVGSLTLFSLHDSETFEKENYYGAGLSRGKRFGHAEAYDQLVRSHIIYRCRITGSEPFCQGTGLPDWV